MVSGADSACDWCGLQFASQNELDTHKEQTQPSDVELKLEWPRRIARRYLSGIEVERDSSSVDYVQSSNVVTPSSTSISRQHNFSSVEPQETTYSRSYSLPRSSLSTVGSPHISSISSSSGYRTAQSSLASYASARSVQRIDLHASSLRGVSEDATASLSPSPKPWNFQSLVETVYAHIINHLLVAHATMTPRLKKLPSTPAQVLTMRLGH